MKMVKPMPNLTESDKSRFWAKVDTRSDGDCWNWSAAKVHDGYGLFTINHRTYRSNRLAYFLAKGEDPREMVVCHSCDNPSCCNPSHLFLGTNKQNTQDAVRKQRLAVGEEQGASKLTAQDVLLMRGLYRMGGISFVAIAEMFGVCKHTAQFAIRGKSWAHLQGAVV